MMPARWRRPGRPPWCWRASCRKWRRGFPQAVKIPTIGIGSGAGCDAQVLVTHDLIGAFPWFKPPFARSRANVAQEITRAVREFVDDVKRPR